MKLFRIPLLAMGLFFSVGFSLHANTVLANNLRSSAIALRDKDSALSKSNIIDLKELIANPKKYDFFTFRPNLEKLILSGTADSKHISILWYTIPNGSVGLHYHSMTESVYTIDGTQTDAKGVYPTGSLYFNPPESGHKITNSTGFFILAYASPPDFSNTDKIKPYTPVQINTADPDLERNHTFNYSQAGVKVYDVPVDPKGGMSSKIIKSTSLIRYKYLGNYLLVLKGSCNINGKIFGKDMLVVAKTIETQSYSLSATSDNSCLALGLSF
ncbi:cupin domain-containing protein [Pseudanabaena sp. BC1403]|uniref:cupin domain-containing protein n=1 Tax=Pseudanabaena sp. BC1403 TaxID=2043171 RepID=UPI000CD8A163|nr:cupin domain-containing protein [Pseudanabaena sp. BC1403]